MNVKNKIIKIVKSFADFPGMSLEVDENSSFVDLGMDSLDVIEVIMEVEEHFQIEIEDIYVDNLRTVSDLITTCSRILGDKNEL